MADYRYLILRASDGEPLGEIPAGDVEFTEILTGDSSFTCSLPLEHAAARDSLISPGLGREIAVIRTQGAAAPECVFNGPIVSLAREIRADGSAVTLSARSPLFYLSKRVTEGARNYGRPVLSAVADLVLTAQGVAPRNPKASGLLYRFTVTPDTGGPVKRWAIGGADRTPILDVIDDLADDDTAGFDYRMEYGYTPAGQIVSRTMRLGFPSLGNADSGYVIEPGTGLLEFTDEQDLARAANRVWVLGAGTAKGSRRAVANNGTALAASGVLLETAIDRTNVADQNTLNGIARALRATLTPPARVITAKYRPGNGLPFRLGNLGDTVRLRVNLGGEQVDLRRRIVGRTVTVDAAGEETVEPLLNQPADEVT